MEKLTRRKYSVHNNIHTQCTFTDFKEASEHRMSIKCSYTKYKEKRLSNTVLVNIISGTLKALQPSSCDLETAKYGKIPRSVAIANNVSQY